MGANPVTYIDNTFQFMDLNDLFSRPDQGRGLRPPDRRHRLPARASTPRGGAEGVGRSTTQAVVLGLDRDPDLRLLPHQDPVLMPTAPPAEDPARAGCRKSRSGRSSSSTASTSTSPTGESVVIIGGSGTGKSVLLKHIIGLLRPDQGRVEVDGVEIERLAGRELTDFRRRFGMAFQEGALFDSMTVFENVAFPLRRARPPSARARSRDRVARVPATWCASRGSRRSCPPSSPAACGGGSASPAPSPTSREILLFDEPTTGLDPVTTAVIDEVIVEPPRAPALDRGDHHPRHEERLPDRRPDRHAAPG